MSNAFGAISPNKVVENETKNGDDDDDDDDDTYVLGAWQC